MSRFDVDKFVPLPDQELICCICTNVLDEPVESPCRHVFCKVCIETWLNNKSNCPTCRNLFTNYDLKPVLPLVRNMLNKLTLMCDFADNGCKDLIVLENYRSHIKLCDYERVVCQYPSCAKSMLRKLIKSHEEEDCPCREITCRKCCGLKVPITELDKHDCLTAMKALCEGKTQEAELVKAELVELRRKYEELQQEVKALKKEASRRRHSSWDSSSTSSQNSDYSVVRLRSRSPRSRSRNPSRSLSRSVSRSPLRSLDTSDSSRDSFPLPHRERDEQEAILNSITSTEQSSAAAQSLSAPGANSNVYICAWCNESQLLCGCVDNMRRNTEDEYHSNSSNHSEGSRSPCSGDSFQEGHFSSESDISITELRNSSTRTLTDSYEVNVSTALGSSPTTSTSGYVRYSTSSRPKNEHNYSFPGAFASNTPPTEDYSPSPVSNCSNSPVPSFERISELKRTYSPTMLTDQEQNSNTRHWTQCSYSPIPVMERNPSSLAPSYSPTAPTQILYPEESLGSAVGYTPTHKSRKYERYRLAPSYSPTAPNYSPRGPDYSPTSPSYSPTAPNYSPPGPVYSPPGPSYSPTGLGYSPSATLKRKKAPQFKLGPSYSPTSALYSHDESSPNYSPTAKSQKHNYGTTSETRLKRHGKEGAPVHGQMALDLTIRNNSVNCVNSVLEDDKTSPDSEHPLDSVTPDSEYTSTNTDDLEHGNTVSDLEYDKDESDSCMSPENESPHLKARKRVLGVKRKRTKKWSCTAVGWGTSESESSCGEMEHNNKRHKSIPKMTFKRYKTDTEFVAHTTTDDHITDDPQNKPGTSGYVTRSSATKTPITDDDNNGQALELIEELLALREASSGDGASVSAGGNDQNSNDDPQLDYSSD